MKKFTFLCVLTIVMLSLMIIIIKKNKAINLEKIEKPELAKSNFPVIKNNNANKNNTEKPVLNNIIKTPNSNKKLPSTEDQRNQIIKEVNKNNAVTIVREMEYHKLSDLFISSLNKPFFGNGGIILGELSNDPHIRRVLEEGVRMYKKDKNGYDELVMTLRDCISRYINDFPEYGASPHDRHQATVLSPGAAMAWPYLLAKLDDNPSNLALIAQMGEKAKECLIRQFERDQAESPSVVLTLSLEHPVRTIAAYAARLYLDDFLASPELQLQLTSDAMLALSEYKDYKQIYDEEMSNMLYEAERVSPGSFELLLDTEDEERESVAARLGLWTQVIPSHHAERESDMFIRSDFLLEIASRVGSVTYNKY